MPTDPTDPAGPVDPLSAEIGEGPAGRHDRARLAAGDPKAPYLIAARSRGPARRQLLRDHPRWCEAAGIKEDTPAGPDPCRTTTSP